MNDNSNSLDKKFLDVVAEAIGMFYENHPTYKILHSYNALLNGLLTSIAEDENQQPFDKISLLEAFICKIEDCKRHIIQQAIRDQIEPPPYINDQDVTETIH